MPLLSTKQFVEKLKQKKELKIIDSLVDPNLELAEIQRNIVKNKGPALLFTNVKNCKFSVATNLYGSESRIEIAFGKKAEKFIADAVEIAEKIFPPSPKKIFHAAKTLFPLTKLGTKNKKKAAVLENKIKSLKELPQIKCWPEDGGAFITLPLVYTQHPQTRKSNLGMYRIQLYNDNTCGLHVQIHRGGGFHYHVAEKNSHALPVHVYVGGPPALTLASIAPLPEDIPEILLASLLIEKKICVTNREEISPLPIIADADFLIVGESPPHLRKPEGPFGDHYGYYSLQHDYPFINVKNIYCRKDAIYPATVVGRPPQEDHYFACYLQDLLKPLIHMVMPQVESVWAYEESGVHSLAAAQVKDRYPREALTTALRILGEGQLSLTKTLLVTDASVDVKDIRSTLKTILERMDFRTDLFVLSNISQDTLDYTGPRVNEGSKAIFLGIGEVKRILPEVFRGEFSDQRFHSPQVFIPGCLVISGTTFQSGDGLSSRLAQEKCLHEWPLVFLTDDAAAATKSPEDFLWHIFTRFEPAADIFARAVENVRFHNQLTPPLVIDCRMKPGYPGVLTVSDEIQQRAQKILSDCL